MRALDRVWQIMNGGAVSMPSGRRRLMIVAVVLAAACSSSAPSSDSSPGDLSINPNKGYSSAPVTTVITGTGFLAKVTQAQSGGEPTLDTRQRAWIGTKELEVTWQSPTRLDATVPAGIEPGTYDLTVENALGNRGTAKAAYTVIDAPIFSATAVVDHPSVNVGQTLTLTTTITNRSRSDVTNFVLGIPVLSSGDGGAASAGAVPTAPSRIGAGEQLNFTWTYTPSHVGTLSIDLSATGIDSITGNTMTARLAIPVAIAIQVPAALSANSSAGAVTSPLGQPVTVTMQLANATGGATAEVTAVTPSTNPATGVVCAAAAPASTGVAPSEAAPIRIAGGATETFSWTCTASASGLYSLSAVVAARDVNAGTSIATSVPAVIMAYGSLAAPTFSPEPRTYWSAQQVTINESTPGAVVHYTTDGTDPTASSATYAGPIGISATTTLKAIAVGPPFANSAITAGTYTISAPPTVYQDINYGGGSQALQAGRYDVQQLTIGNDVISSVRVPAGWRVTLYLDAGFQGATRVLTGDTPSLLDFNDQTSSVVVEQPQP